MIRVGLDVARPNGRASEAVKVDDQVTPAMLDAAEDLLHTLTTGERLLPKDLYDVCARAFDTTRDDAKQRLTLAMYGGKTVREPTLIGWTWRAHLNELHADVRAKKWLRVTKKLSLMLSHAIDALREGQNEEIA